MSRNRFTLLVTKLLAVAMVFVLFLSAGIGGRVYAISSSDLNSIIGQTPFYDPNDTSSCNGSASDTVSVPAGNLASFIPEPYNGAFTLGAQKHNIAPALIAALFSEEHALSGDTHTVDTSKLPLAWATFVKSQPDPNSGWGTSPVGATGPFQFLPSTWKGLGYNIDDINKLVVAADAAGKYAQNSGATKDAPVSKLHDFAYSYGGGANWYADAVLKYYQYYNAAAGAPPGGAPSLVSNVSDSCANTTVNCSGGATPGGTVSTVRSNVVCLAQQELALWKQQPGYPDTAYAKTGYQKYSQGVAEEWCADFASWLYNQSNYPLKPAQGWRVSYVPNIQAVGEQNQKFHWHPESSGYTPKPGDLAIHGGKHVNIFISAQGNTATYIGGDQGHGPYPGGSVVSIEIGNGFYADGITGYVSPD